MKSFTIILGIVIIIVGAILVWQNLFKTPAVVKKAGDILPGMDIMPKTLEGKKVAIIIAFRDFRDEEYFIPKEVLENSGAEVRTVSTEKGIAIGSQGGEANVNIILSEIKVSDFDAIVFIGGPGAPKYLDNETSYKIAQDAVLQGKILAAICISPTILAKSGVLSGKKATVWSSPLDKSAVKILKDSGANYQSDRVVIDGKIITANGPDAAGDFAEAIIRVLNPVLAP